ncbi:hypothetical protein PUN28_004050 [Cardiocondyla obscurior]|uniref:Gustatory receptor n=2 Tax=Cardiocondyla obscurior TaxID=286306 RepID=A0AAW2GNX8_9HYME
MPYRNIKFLLTIYKVLGLVPFRLTNYQLKSKSYFNRCFCTTWILVHCFCGSLDVLYLILFSDSSAKDRELSIVRSNAYFISLIPFNFVAAFHSESFVKLSYQLLTYDQQAIALGHQRKDKHTFIYLYFLYTFITLIWKCYYPIRDNISKGLLVELMLFLTVVIPSIIGTYCVFVICVLLDLVRQRFRHLNEKIIPQVVQLSTTGSKGEITVYDVRYLHNILLNYAYSINSIYGVGVLLTFISILMELIWHTYSLIKDFQQDNLVIDDFVEILDLLFQTIYLFSMYHFTAYEVNRVENLVVKHGLSFSNPKCRMDKIEMMLYFYHRRYCFTAAEFFPLDMTIFLPISTTVLTYITLII